MKKDIKKVPTKGGEEVEAAAEATEEVAETPAPVLPI